MFPGLWHYLAAGPPLKGAYMGCGSGTCCRRPLCICKILRLQVRKVLWKLFEIWPTPQAAARAELAVLAEVEKLLQPLGLFRKRTVAIKRLSQEYLETQVSSAPYRCADLAGVSLCAQQQVWQAAAA